MKMNKYFDHTLLAANATRSEVEQLCKEAREYDFMSVCVNPYFVPLANKGLEVIEASFLFDFKPEDIEVTVHRQSVVHSMVRTQEGAVYAQMSPPDMTLPIISALSDEKLQLRNVVSPLSFSNLNLTFEKPDTLRFPLLSLAYKALEIDGSATIAYNAADEVAVNAFMEGLIPYSRISEIVKTTIEDPTFKEKVSNYEETMKKDRSARIIARKAL